MFHSFPQSANKQLYITRQVATRDSPRDNASELRLENNRLEYGMAHLTFCGFSWSFTVSSGEFHDCGLKLTTIYSFECSKIFYLLMILPDRPKHVHMDTIDNIKTDVKEIGWEGWIGLKWLSLVRTVMNFQLP
jgi:hypothetical protein